MSSFSALHAYYAADVASFLVATPETILGIVATNSQFEITSEQRDAWLAQIKILKPALTGVRGAVFLEFNVPRIGSRIDAVLLSGSAIFPIEFKVGEEHFARDYVNQVWDYALDLKNFHSGSHAA